MDNFIVKDQLVCSLIFLINLFRCPIQKLIKLNPLLVNLALIYKFFFVFPPGNVLKL